MSKPIEKELKVLLSEDEYNKLESEYDFPIMIDQTNIYYDTPDQFIRNLPGAMRIRKIGDKTYFTLKIRKDPTSNYEYEKETNSDDIHNQTDPEILGWIKDAGIPMNQVVELGRSHTIRKMNKTEDAEICLDYTDFGKKHDYEIEYEFKRDHDGEKVFDEILSKVGKKFEKNCPSKIARALTD